MISDSQFLRSCCTSHIRRLLEMGANVVRVGNRRFVPEELLHVTLDGKLSTLAEKEGKAVSFRYVLKSFLNVLLL